MSEPTKIRATLKGNEGDVRVLMPHPMESGLRKDAAGQIAPAHFITSLTLSLNGRPVIEGALGTAISTNPLFAFMLRDVRPGDRVAIAWVDNRGQKGAAETTFSAA